MILIVRSTVDGTRTVTFETSGSVKVTLTMWAQDVGRAVSSISGFVFVAVRLQTTAAMFSSVPRASMLSLMIVAFETHEAEVRAPEKTFDRREGIVMVVVVEQCQKSVAVSVRYQRVCSRGVDDDDLVVVQTRCHDHARQFVRSPSPGTESRFSGQSFSGLLSTMDAPSGIGPLFTSMSILTGQRQTTCRDDGSDTAPTGVVPGHLDQGLFNLFETNVRLMTGQVLAFSTGPTW